MLYVMVWPFSLFLTGRSDGVPHVGLAAPPPGRREDPVQEHVRGLHGPVHAVQSGADPPGAPPGVPHHTAERCLNTGDDWKVFVVLWAPDAVLTFNFVIDSCRRRVLREPRGANHRRQTNQGQADVWGDDEVFTRSVLTASCFSLCANITTRFTE